MPNRLVNSSPHGLSGIELHGQCCCSEMATGNRARVYWFRLSQIVGKRAPAFSAVISTPASLAALARTGSRPAARSSAVGRIISSGVAPVCSRLAPSAIISHGHLHCIRDARELTHLAMIGPGLHHAARRAVAKNNTALFHLDYAREHFRRRS